ncbi:MAG TPA: cytochrome c maturation protein CcmE [Longimicrobiales bacterium]|nr:cytochrome c maturation protein CcmE [Longimicrobiales bacterium]
MKKNTGRRLVLAAGIITLLSSFGYLMWGGIGESLVYFLTPTELEAKGPAGYEVPVRLGGTVKAGTVEWDAKALDLRFWLTDGDKEVAVHAGAAPPQMFREGIGVIVEGRLQQDGVFQATSVMVKHSNEYRPPHEGERPDQLYKDLIREGGS